MNNQRRREFLKRVWQWVHNCIAHPLEGWVVLFMGQCPPWVDEFHDWTARKAWTQWAADGD